MATKSIAWNTGTGNITLTYQGQGNGSIQVSSDPNNLETQRTQVITVSTANGLVSRNLTIVQAAKTANFILSDGQFLGLSDGKYFNVQE